MVGRQPLATRLLSTAWQKQRLLPAYLFIGRADPDKWELAKQLASQLNCQKSDQNVGRSCLTEGNLSSSTGCVNCRWIAEDVHPQSFTVLTGQGSKTGKIPVEQARKLALELAKDSQYYRVIVIENASQDSFHRPAANALLKTIEESHPRILLAFFALSASEVLPTIVSRCQCIEIRGSTLAEAGNWSLFKPVGSIPKIEAGELAEIAALLKDSSQLAHNKLALGSLAITEKLQDLVSQKEFDLDEMVDLIVALELERASTDVLTQPGALRYAQRLLSLSEIAKNQNRQFVSKKAVLESFAFAWSSLRAQFKCS